MQLGVLALGVALILFGALNAIFDFKLDPKLENDISNYILIAAAVLFVYSRQLRTKETLAAKAEEEAETEALEVERDMDNIEKTDTIENMKSDK